MTLRCSERLTFSTMRKDAACVRKTEKKGVQVLAIAHTKGGTDVEPSGWWGCYTMPEKVEVAPATPAGNASTGKAGGLDAKKLEVVVVRERLGGS